MSVYLFDFIPHPSFLCSVFESHRIFLSFLNSLGFFVVVINIISFFIYLVSIFNHFYCYSITIVLIFSPLPSSAHSSPTRQSIPTVFHVCGLFIPVLCLVLSPSFYHCLPLPSPLVTFSLFHVSTPVVLFCSLVYFVY